MARKACYNHLYKNQLRLGGLRSSEKRRDENQVACTLPCAVKAHRPAHKNEPRMKRGSGRRMVSHQQARRRGREEGQDTKRYEYPVASFFFFCDYYLPAPPVGVRFLFNTLATPTAPAGVQNPCVALWLQPWGCKIRCCVGTRGGPGAEGLGFLVNVAVAPH